MKLWANMTMSFAAIYFVIYSLFLPINNEIFIIKLSIVLNS